MLSWWLVLLPVTTAAATAAVVQGAIDGRPTAFLHILKVYFPQFEDEPRPMVIKSTNETRTTPDSAATANDIDYVECVHEPDNQETSLSIKEMESPRHEHTYPKALKAEKTEMRRPKPGVRKPKPKPPKPKPPKPNPPKPNPPKPNPPKPNPPKPNPPKPNPPNPNPTTMPKSLPPKPTPPKPPKSTPPKTTPPKFPKPTPPKTTPSKPVTPKPTSFKSTPNHPTNPTKHTLPHQEEHKTDRPDPVGHPEPRGGSDGGHAPPTEPPEPRGGGSGGIKIPVPTIIISIPGGEQQAPSDEANPGGDQQSQSGNAGQKPEPQQTSQPESNYPDPTTKPAINQTLSDYSPLDERVTVLAEKPTTSYEPANSAIQTTGQSISL